MVDDTSDKDMSSRLGEIDGDEDRKPAASTLARFGARSVIAGSAHFRNLQRIAAQMLSCGQQRQEYCTDDEQESARRFWCRGRPLSECRDPRGLERAAFG